MMRTLPTGGSKMSFQESKSEKPSSENHLNEEEAKWFAVYTKYKREKMVAKYLSQKNIEHYLPLQQFTRHYAKKTKKVELPLISCYIFTKIKKSEYVPVLETPDVVHFVRFSNNLISIPEAEIEVLKRVVGEGIPLQIEKGCLALGDEVEIIGGSLTGLSGVLLEKQNQKSFVIELSSMGYSLIMQVNPAFLHPKNAVPGRLRESA